MDVWLLLAGEFAPPPHLPQAGDVAVAVDGGMRHAAALGVVPSLWLGDFDSSDAALAAQYAAVPRLAFPTDKDETDAELALAYVSRHFSQARVVQIIGAAGGEADHAFANLWVLPRFALPALLYARTAMYAFAHGPVSWDVHGQAGGKVSMFALTAIHGLANSGLRWTADNLSLTPFRAHGARNELCAAHATIRWQRGAGLVIAPAAASGTLHSCIISPSFTR
ncbi:thiamine diphosphokinase [Cardiobacterium valvarum]|uniref:Thiamine diphosphokinase n=1 Tax=Cardiobacterium valvarum TaxID=194702 RepID=A0A381E4G3_9GAMM|nr:thiamine diphosphokinase [Cardiobacterium valvarum]SUX21070.1 Thiamine pyrophosphokinase [Cardiobacterium valvarum]